MKYYKQTYCERDRDVEARLNEHAINQRTAAFPRHRTRNNFKQCKILISEDNLIVSGEMWKEGRVLQSNIGGKPSVANERGVIQPNNS